jgi:parallel beta-helix repeat protein
MSNADAYLQDDDGSTTYTLPWTFPYFGRSITAIEFNTNGLIELLEAGETCYECDDYGTHDDGDHEGNMDAIFASNDDLQTDDTSDSYVAVCNFTDRIVVEWNGSTYYDYDTAGYNTNFQVVMYPNGTIEWNFNVMDWWDFDYDMFSGLYALEEDVEGYVGYEIDVQESYVFDPSKLSGTYTVTGNTLAHNGDGVYVDQAAIVTSVITDNTIFNNTAGGGDYNDGIRLNDYVKNVWIEGNLIYDNDYGVDINPDSDTTTVNITIFNNTILSHTSDGIYARLLEDSSMRDNIIQDNGNGLYLDNVNGTTITGNTANSNSQYGIYLSGSSGNTIYNNFFNNTANAGFGGTVYANDWNTTKTAGTNIVGGPYLGGSYWTKPDGTGFSETCTDADADGICDSSNSLASGNVDYLPLIADPTPPTVTVTSPQNITYNAATITLNISTDETANVTYSLNGAANVSLYNMSTQGSTTLTAVEGGNNVTVYAVDAFNNLDSTTVYFTVDTTTPSITFVSPTPSNGTAVSARDSVTINATLSETGTPWLEWDGTNESMVGGGTVWYQSKQNIPEGSHTYRVWANDSAGNLNVSETRTLRVRPVEVSLSTDAGQVEMATVTTGCFAHCATVNVSDLPSAGRPDLTFPCGLFNFTIEGLTPGQSVTLTITLPINLPQTAQYWKYNSSSGTWYTIPFGSNDGDNVITITLTDGGIGDADGVANGVISDPGGPGLPSSAVPALTPLGAALLAGLGGGLGFRRLRGKSG